MIMNKISKIFGKRVSRKVRTDMKCCLKHCNNRARYIGGDGLLTFWFACKEHRREVETAEMIPIIENEVERE